MTGPDTPEAIPPSLETYTGYLLARAFNHARYHGEHAMPEGRRPRDVAILTALADLGPISQRRLGDLLGVNRTMMVMVIDALEEAGLARRDRDPADRRSYAVTLTDAGELAIGGLLEAAAEGETALTAQLTPAERERLNELLRQMLADSAGLPTELRTYTGFLIATGHRVMRERARAALRELDFEPRHFGLLSALADVEPCSQQQLADQLGISAPAVIGTIDELQAAGRLDRDRDPGDRRRHVLRITPKGRTELAEARTVIDRLHSDLTDQVGAAGRAELDALLVKLVQ